MIQYSMDTQVTNHSCQISIFAEIIKPHFYAVFCIHEYKTTHILNENEYENKLSCLLVG